MNDLLNPTRTQALFTLKVFGAAMLAYAIALHFGLERPYWAVGTVYIASNPLSGASTSKAFYRLAGTVLGGIMTVILVPNFVNAPELLTLLMALWVGGCLFISLLDRRARSYTFMLAGYTVVIAGIPMVNHPDASFAYAVSRVEEIGLGVVCAALVNRLVFPLHTGPVLHARVSGWLKNAGDLARDTLLGRGDTATADQEQRRLAADAVDLRGMSDTVSYDTSHHQDFFPLTQALQQRMIWLLPVLSGLKDQIEALNLHQGRFPAVVRLVQDTADWLQSSSAGRGEGPRGEGDDVQEAARLVREIKALERSHAARSSWDDAGIVNLCRRLHSLIETWSECSALRDDIRQGKARSLRSQRALRTTQALPIHRDHFLAALSGLSAVVGILIASAFWMASGWSGGTAMAQLAGVFCCILAGLDDIVPALRKFLTYTLYAMGVAFVVQFFVLPWIDGFWPLIAVLGLILIPSGILMTKPATFMLGMAMCVNFIYVLQPQESLNLNFQTFLIGNLSMVMGILCAILSCSLVRSVGAEASLVRVLRQAWKRVAATAVETTPTAKPVLIHQMIDAVGINAPRLAAVPSESAVRTNSLVRDLRAAINISDIKLAACHGDASLQAQIAHLSDHVARFYRTRRLVPDTQALGRLLQEIDDCLMASAHRGDSDQTGDLRSALVGLRLCLAPHDVPGVAWQSSPSVMGLRECPAQ